MKKLLFTAICLLSGITSVMAQAELPAANQYQNTADMLLTGQGKLGIGGYGEVHFNQPFSTGTRELGSLDVHRVVLFVGYNFSKNTQFISEIEFEHANEIWVEQAFLQHRITPSVNFRAGLMLVPMGIVNEYHEPTTFNGVERPGPDSKLAPSTWREIGAGFSGTVAPLTLKYQLYVVGGLNGYDAKGILSGSKGIRDARQKGVSAYVSSPNFAGKLEYYGIRNLNVGVSGYFGQTQSKLFAKLDSDNASKVARADSSSVGIAMLGADARYKTGGLELRGQLYSLAASNTEQYNKFTAVNGKTNDLGELATGYYLEAGYNLLRPFSSVEKELVAFARYEYINMHQKVTPGMAKNDKYKTTGWTTGLTCYLTRNAVIKTDVQFTKTAADTKFTKTFNAGIGVMF